MKGSLWFPTPDVYVGRFHGLYELLLAFFQQHFPLLLLLFGHGHFGQLLAVNSVNLPSQNREERVADGVGCAQLSKGVCFGLVW